MDTGAAARLPDAGGARVLEHHRKAARRRRARARAKAHASDATAPFVAALERIYITEPKMAGSSSTGGGDGLFLSLSVYSLL